MTYFHIEKIKYEMLISTTLWKPKLVGTDSWKRVLLAPLHKKLFVFSMYVQVLWIIFI